MCEYFTLICDINQPKKSGLFHFYSIAFRSERVISYRLRYKRQTHRVKWDDDFLLPKARLF